MPISDDEQRKRKRKQKQKEYSRRYYEKNADKVRAVVARTKRVNRAAWHEWKAQQACAHCGEDHPATFDFHHLDPKTKLASVNKLISDGKFAKAREEVKKCIVLCANCHRKLHDELHNKKGPHMGPFS